MGPKTAQAEACATKTSLQNQASATERWGQARTGGVMKTLGNVGDKREMDERLGKLRAGAPRRWGRM